jgi:hypothetical protein
MFPNNGPCHDYIPHKIVVQAFPNEETHLQTSPIEQKNRSAMVSGSLFDDH